MTDTQNEPVQKRRKINDQEKAVIETNLVGLKKIYSGKVRDVYEVDEHTLLQVATDRISCFDVVMSNGIPGKGKILTQLSQFWFDYLSEHTDCLHHLITSDVDKMPDSVRQHADIIRGRAQLVKKLDMLPIESVVRGYLTGSGFKDYCKTGSVCGITLPKGIVDCQQLEKLIYTPATKAEYGAHDENISADKANEALNGGKETGDAMAQAAMKYYKIASTYAKSKGIILADTKFEFGRDKEGRLVLGDEVLTPDSSRFWELSKYEPGRQQDSLDKQFVRNYLLSINFDKTNPVDIPQEICTKTMEKYSSIYQLLTESPPVQVRACGKSGLVLPVVGVGTWSWGGDAESYWGTQEQKNVDAVVDTALEFGCNFFDTAEAYNAGKSEIQVGKALKDRFGDAIVCSKVLPSNCTPTAIRQSLQGTLSRLGTNSIDLYLVHWPLIESTMKGAYSETAVVDCFKTLQELQKEKLIKHIGVSNFGVKQLTEALSTGVTIVVNQLAYNLLSRAIEFEVMPLCVKNEIGIIAYSPLMQGLLTNKFGALSEIPDVRLRTRQFSGKRNKSRHGEEGFEDLTWQAILNIRKIADDAKIDMAALCIAWTLANPGITCVIPGNRTKEQMKNNAKAATMEIPNSVVDALNKVTDELKEKMGSAIDIYEALNNQRSY